MKRNTSLIGEISETQILSKLISLGYSVSIPYGNSQRYDLIVDNGILFRVQCKTGRIKNGALIFKAFSINCSDYINKNYCGQVDVICVYCPDNNKIYWVPMKFVGKKKVIYLRVEKTKCNRVKGTTPASDFEI